ncbi:acetoacetate--CoA ligase [Leptospira interrogans]|uniref:Acetoacetate--CoA ligase n=7 Tax=Leptospira interrogans TaxID=173 RepID=A0A1X8WHM1_LEPIR|nr:MULTISPECIES: acetoacetate--CoA ligase [Leptospira]EMF71827.1 acetoacetate-CoA ligase [Leptospira interrogans serovar Canicola str. LT1962]EMG23625.1 acetoacetate-CoA ligase [Leptospira interrogans serovar Copenhageni str. LT2050]EMN29184.1 acetoacetate-CoA ligase [Leptospira interrogans serovar Pyrogenes str. L0374]EMN71620.1 acetoacetate-CoA ligase [Leptospira interrogans serovar Bataviae str. UI 08561]EMO04628.1 acetoacetate-CoA ligase [Leptospira interrogans serovar Icterohaemorrhagiae 
MDQKLWTPSSDRIESSNLVRYIKFLKEKKNLSLSTFEELRVWSVNEIGSFWESIWEFSEVVHSQKYDLVYQSGSNFTDSKFFPGAKLNFAENLLRRTDSFPALIYRGEDGSKREVSYAELYSYVGAVATDLKKRGVVPGDRVVGLMPNVPETVIAMLATTSIGAIWSSCSPDFGVKGVLDRFGQIEPKILFTTNLYSFKGKDLSLAENLTQILKSIPSIEAVIVSDYKNGILHFKNRTKTVLPENYPQKNIHLFETVLFENEGASPNFYQTNFDHPVYIMYSSGTTGLPKCMVQGVGVFLNHWKELALHCDLKPGERIFYYTTCGWMMWNWLVSSLSIGATLVLFDGNPFFPTQEILFQIASEEKINVFGVGAKYILTLEKSKFQPKDFDLSTIRTVLSTGSPLTTSGFRYVYQHWKKDLQLSSISGGTDLNGCFALGNPILPVYEGEIQCRGLGMDVEIWNESAKSVIEQKGELVCKQPFPSMPLYFWKDPEGKKYKSAYFESYPSVWCHGDFAELKKSGGLVVYGRSDATLNPGGVRIGTSDIYGLIETFTEIADSVIIGQDWKEDVRIVLFLKMIPGKKLEDSLVQTLKREIKEKISPKHVPSKILEVADIPYTINMKKVEIAVKKTIQGEPVTNKEALSNPESLEYYKNILELKED